MSFASFGHNTTSPLAIVIDMGSASVGAALVQYHEEAAPEVLYSTRSTISYDDKYNYDQYLRSALSTLFNVVLTLQENAIETNTHSKSVSMRDVSEIVCVFSSLWCRTETYTISIASEEEFTVTKELLESEIDNEEDQILQLYTQSHRSAPVLVDRKFIHTTLNGYATANPYDKKVHRVEATALVTLMPTHVHERVQDVLEQLFSVRDIAYRSFNLASFLVIRDVFSDIEDFIHINVTGGVTDIQLVQHDTVVQTNTFNKGVHFIGRTIAEELNTTPQEATSLLMSYAEGSLEQGTMDMVRPVIKKAQNDWIHELSMYFNQALDESTLPRNVFLTTDARLQQWFADLIQSDTLSKFTLASKPFTVKPLDISQLRSHLDADTIAADSYLFTDIIYADRELFC